MRGVQRQTSRRGVQRRASRRALAGAPLRSCHPPSPAAPSLLRCAEHPTRALMRRGGRPSMMSNRVAPSRHQADNPAGNFTSAACTDWHDVRRFHVGTDHCASTSDAGYTTACASAQPSLSISLLPLRGSPYMRLGFSTPNVDVLFAMVSDGRVCRPQAMHRFPRGTPARFLGYWNSRIVLVRLSEYPPHWNFCCGRRVEERP